MKLITTVASPKGSNYIIELKNEKIVSLEKGISTIEYVLKRDEELFEGTRMIKDFDSNKYVNCIVQIVNDHKKQQGRMEQRDKIKKEALKKLEEWDGKYFLYIN